MSNETMRDLVAAYVLDALDADERAAFEKALAEDPSLRDEIRAYEDVVAGLATAVPEHQPPAALRERILDEARSERPLRTVDGGASGSGGAGPGASSPRGGLAGVAWLAAAAALAGAIGLGVAYRGASSTATELGARVEQLAEDLERARAEIADKDSLLTTFVGADVRFAALSATGQPPSARLYWNTSTRTVVIAAADLPPAPAGRVYQLWGIAEGSDPVSLGTFQTDPDGTTIVSRPVPEGFDFSLGAVTEEPAGGSPQPTTTPFLVGQWTD